MTKPEDDISIAAFETTARATIARFPPAFAKIAIQVLLRVEDLPPKHLLAEMEIEDPLDLTGLYDGIPMTEKRHSDPALFPDIVWLFREPILAEWRDRGDIALPDLIAHVVVHEFAHHFGWSDEDIATIDQWWL